MKRLECNTFIPQTQLEAPCCKVVRYKESEFCSESPKKPISLMLSKKTWEQVPNNLFVAHQLNHLQYPLLVLDFLFRPAR